MHGLKVVELAIRTVPAVNKLFLLFRFWRSDEEMSAFGTAFNL